MFPNVLKKRIGDVSACNDLKEGRRRASSSRGEAAITHSIRRHEPHPSPPLPHSHPRPTHRALLYVLAQLEVQGHSSRRTFLSGEQEKSALCAGVIDDYGTTASGIMPAGAIYKQKHGRCLCQLRRILPFLSQTPLERALHSGSNVIFYWESTIPHIEMAEESY